jgi:integrase
VPSRQRGFARKRGDKWLAVWREDRKEASRGGFETRTAALDYANGKAERAVARAAALRFGDELPAERPQIATVQELVDAFLAAHRVDEATLRKLRSQLKHATTSFGGRRIETLQPIELDLWRSQLPALSAHYIFRAFRQVLEYAVVMGLLEGNPTARIKNVRASVEVKRGQQPFATWDEVEAVAAELDPRVRGDPDRARWHWASPGGVVCARTPRPRPRGRGAQRRARLLAAPLEGLCQVAPPAKAGPTAPAGRGCAAFDAAQARYAAPVPAARGGYIDLEKFRYREWIPALRAAGIEHRRVYDCRHTFASWAIAGGVQLFYLARIMGTSVAQIDATYGHLLPDSEEYLRGLLDDYDSRAEAI